MTTTSPGRRIQFIDTSLRDGHQSLLATRMSTEQCMRVLPLLRESGYSILELWGGATLDAAMRFTGDDPFERLDRFREALGGRIAIRSLCRGQNLFGYSPYPDNVVVEFLKEAVRSGNDRVRIFDALNDPRNLTTAIMATKTFNGHAEAAISYTTSPVHDRDHFVRFAARAMDAGADSLAIKDMAGLLHPADCFELVHALREQFPKTPITLHSHNTNGLANATYIAGMLAGVDYLDTAHGPMAGASAQPPVELMRFVAEHLGYEHNLVTDRFGKIDEALRGIRGELNDADKDPEHMGRPWPDQPDHTMRQRIEQACKLIASEQRDKCDQAIAILEDQLMVEQGYPPVDRAQLESQIPGGMLSNLHKQLKDQDKLDLLPEILKEVPRVRAEAGYPPLVTPSSQIVGTQASFNVATGKRYGMMSNEFRNLVTGKYGRPPGKVDPELLQTAAPDGQVYDRRPGDYVDDIDLEGVYREHNDLIRSHRDLLLLLLFPGPAKTFLAQREGVPAG